MAADRGLNAKRRRRLSDDVKRAQSGGGSCWLTWRAENFACASRRAVPRARAARAAHSHLGLWLSLRVLAQLPPLLPPSPPPMHELERTVGVLAAPTDRCEPAAREIAHCCAASASLCADSAQARPVDAHSKWRPSQLPCEGERRWRAYKNAPAAGAAGCARLVRRAGGGVSALTEAPSNGASVRPLWPPILVAPKGRTAAPRAHTLRLAAEQAGAGAAASLSRRRRRNGASSLHFVVAPALRCLPFVRPARSFQASS